MSAVRQFRAEGERPLKVPWPPAPATVFAGVWRARGSTNSTPPPTSGPGIKERPSAVSTAVRGGKGVLEPIAAGEPPLTVLASSARHRGDLLRW